MLRTFIFLLLVSTASILTGQEIHIPKIPVYGTPLVPSNISNPPIYYVPHYIQTPTRMYDHNFPYPPVIYYPPVQSGSIIMQYRPTRMGNFMFGPKIYYNPNPLIVR